MVELDDEFVIVKAEEDVVALLLLDGVKASGDNGAMVGLGQSSVEVTLILKGYLRS